MCAVAYFYAHYPRGFFPILNGGELAALYSFVFLYLAAAGGGAWSVDKARGAA
jgi:putative oxidoreductase